MRGAWLSAAAAATFLGPASPQTVEVHFAHPVGAALADELRAALGAGVDVRAAGGDAVAAGTVLIAPEPRLQQLLTAHAFVPPGVTFADVERRQARCLPWTLRYVVATTGIDAEGLGSFEALALARAVHDRLLLCAPDVDAGPWLLGMQEYRLRGQQEAAGLGLWMALDARVERYCSDYTEVLASLADGRPHAAVVPRPLLVRPGLPEGCTATDLGDAGVPIGLAIVGPEAAVAAALAERLLEPALRRRVASALDLSPASPRDLVFPRDAVLAWLRYHEEQVAGRGRGIERVADALDWAFTLLFVALVAFVWHRHRRRGT
jgi:hypothetical protein